jgi:hypothetical protein
MPGDNADAPIKEQAVENSALSASVRMTAEERGTLEAKTSGRLAALFDDSTPAPVAKKAAAKAAEVEEETETEQVAEDAAESESVEKTETEEDNATEVEAAAEDDKAPTLPDSYRRSLKSYGWDDKEIDKNLKVLGV